MATIKRSYAALTMLKRTVLYGGVTNNVSGQTYVPTGDVDLETNGYFGAHVIVKFKGNNKQDKFVCDVFGSHDGSSYDTEPLQRHELQSDGTEQQFSFIILDVLHFRCAVKSSDTNTEFEYEITYQAWNQSNA